MESSQRGFGSRFWSLIAATFLGFLGMGTVLPALAPHVVHDLNGSDRTVGWVIGTFSFVALGCRFISGPLADRRGRKITVQIGLLSCALAGVGYLIPLHLFGIFLGRALQGLGEACLYTGAATWAVELAGVERGSQALGYVSSAIWGGVSAGPAVGHWLGSFGRAAGLQMIAALAALLLASFVGETFLPHGETRRKFFRPSLLPAGLAVGFVNVHYPVITGFLILHLAKHGNSGSAAFTTYALVILLSRFFLGKLPDRLPASITFNGGLVGMGIGLIILATGPRPPVAIFATGILGFGFSFPWSSIAATVLRRTPANEHGSTIGFISAFYDLFVGVSSVAAGFVASRFGYPAAFSMAAIALIVAAVAGRFVFVPSDSAVSPKTEPEEVTA